MNREVHVRFWESARLKCLALLDYLKGYADGHEAKAGIAEWIRFTILSAHISPWELERRWQSGVRASPVFSAKRLWI
ncbi:MAG: hypothetical protein JO320_20730 [Alphaproteobacteria bacterium]|nr:hypothetical protein [Alphaproteobacteria bacterium]MBV9377444.1 hypothetical protein [Alphaproteobacteria bacterium]